MTNGAGLTDDEIEFVREVIRARARRRAFGKSLRSWTTWLASVLSIGAVAIEAVRRLLMDGPGAPN